MGGQAEGRIFKRGVLRIDLPFHSLWSSSEGSRKGEDMSLDFCKCSYRERGGSVLAKSDPE